MGKKVLVTGADGFIGSHLTEELVKQGYDVRAFVYYNSFNTWGWLDTLPKDIMEHIEIFSGIPDYGLRSRIFIYTTQRGSLFYPHISFSPRLW